MVYLTPEKLNTSTKLMKLIQSLYERGKIARLVIDEAHCVSVWGHDFRKDYTQLGALRSRLFPNTPVMLLTATATPRVRQDIILQMNLSFESSSSKPQPPMSKASKLEQKLGQRNYLTSSAGKSQKCAFFIQSFNRENLQYKVELKTSNPAAFEKIAEQIKTSFMNKSGIVYCISRNECENVAKFLRGKSIKAMPYHAGMSDKDRMQTQDRWSRGHDCKVVCATIAFGMGVDKP